MEYYHITEIGNIKMEPEVLIPDYEPVPEIIQIDSDEDDIVEIKDEHSSQYFQFTSDNIPPLQALSPQEDGSVGYWFNGQWFKNLKIEQRDVYRCSCGEEYVGMENLNLHQETKHLKCIVCKKFFLTDKFLKIHVKNDHPSVNILFDCLICNKSFGTKKTLQEHSILHKEIFKCKYCESGFSAAGLLKEHENSEHSIQISHNSSKFSTFNEAFASFANSKEGLSLGPKFTHNRSKTGRNNS